MSTKILKIVGLGFVAVVSLLLLATTAIVVLVDPNDFRDDITAAVQDATGRELRIDGELKLSLFPWLGLRLGETSLSNTDGFKEKDFLRVASVDINVKLLPLLQQRLEMKTVRLRGLRVNLSRSEDGRNNWDDLLSKPSADIEPLTTRSTTGSPATSLAALAIGGLNIEDAHIIWDDQQVGQRVEVKQFSLRTGAIASNAPIDIKLKSQFSASEPALQTPVELQARLILDAQAQRYQLEKLDVSLNMQSEMLPVSPMNLRLTGNVNADMAQQQVQFSGVQLHTLGLIANLEITLTNILSTPEVEGKLFVADFSPRNVAKILGVALPTSADKKVFNKAAFTINFTGSSEAVTANKLDVLLDDSQFSGNLRVRNFSQPAVHFNVTLDGIDADRYLPPPAETTPPSPTGAAVASTPLPLDALRALDINGELRVGKLTLANIRSTDILLGITANAGKIRLSPLKADLYHGQYHGLITLDVRKDEPKISANEKLSAVQVGPLLKDILGEEKVSGIANMAANITAVGMTPEAITKSLKGTASFSFKDGAVKGVNLGQIIREAYAKIKKKPAPAKTHNQTDFTEMSGSVNIRNGIINNQDLRTNSPALRIAGKGRVDLPKQRINYLLNASIVETDQGQGGKDASELTSLSIPIKITGTFEKPKLSLDLGPVLKAKAKVELARQKKKLKRKIKKKLDGKKANAKKKLEEKLKDKLKGLFR